MNDPTSIPYTLSELLEQAPADKIAIILPEQDIRVTYAALRAQVLAVAEQLAAAGVRRGDRVALSVAERPAGDRVVSGRVGRRDGRSAEPRVQRRRIPFLSGRHSREGLDPPSGRSRRRASSRRRRRSSSRYRGRCLWHGQPERCGRPRTGNAAGGGRHRAGAAHERQHRASEACSSEAREPFHLGAERRSQLRAHVR